MPFGIEITWQSVQHPLMTDMCLHYQGSRSLSRTAEHAIRADRSEHRAVELLRVFLPSMDGNLFFLAILSQSRGSWSMFSFITMPSMSIDAWFHDAAW